MNELDKKSLENAKKLFSSGVINSVEIGTINGLQQIHKFLFDVQVLFEKKIFLKETLDLAIYYI